MLFCGFTRRGTTACERSPVPARKRYRRRKDKRAARARTELVTLNSDGVLLLETPKVLRDRIEAVLGASEDA